MKKLVLLCIMLLSLGAHAQDKYKVRKTYSALYNRITDSYDYANTTYPQNMYVTFITKMHFKINDENHSEYWTQSQLSEDKDVNCVNFYAIDEKNEAMGLKVCNVDNTKSITILYPEKYYVIYYLEN